MFSLLEVLLYVIIYTTMLYSVVVFLQRKKLFGKINKSPLTYSLTLAAYCTAWTFYGSVGSSAKSGVIFLTIYLGPMISIILWDSILRKLIRAKEQYKITSIADFVSTRYGKSAKVAFIATSLALIGTIPYISLQIKAIIGSISLLTSNEALGFLTEAFIVVLIIMGTIILGIKKVSLTERHPKMITVIALENIVKLVTFILIGSVAFFVYNEQPWNFFNDLKTYLPESYAYMGNRDFKDIATWATYLILATNAILFLPRQFHIAVVENNNENHITHAKWQFGLYLFLINLFVLPIVVTAYKLGFTIEQADQFIVNLSMLKGSKYLAIAIFIGGFSAASGMIMLSTMTVSTMVSNHIVIPILKTTNTLNYLSKYLLQIRWISAFVLITSSYMYMKVMEGKYALVAMGMISFSAALQFAPAIILGLYWKEANKRGVFCGTVPGALIWLYTLVLPAFCKSGFISMDILEYGPFGISFLRPENLFGLTGLHYLTNSLIWTMFFNITGFVIGSLSYEQSVEEEKISKEIVFNLSADNEGTQLQEDHEREIEKSQKKEIVQTTLRKYFTDKVVETYSNDIFKDIGHIDHDLISIIELFEIRNRLETKLTGAIGSANASSDIESSGLFTEIEKEALSNFYAKLITDLNVDPRELNKRINLYKEKQDFILEQNNNLEKLVAKRTEELESQKEKTFQASKLSALGEMASGIAHEINNPLTIISSTSSLIRRLSTKDKLSSDRLHEQLGDIDRTVKRINSIINGMKNLSRDTSRDDFAETRITDIVEDCLGICESKFKSAGVMFTINMNDEAKNSTISCKRIDISRVIINFLNNAFDVVSELEEKWIVLDIDIFDNLITFSLTDSGKGISEEVQEKIFQPFFTTKEIGKGTGLGLSLSKTIIEDHGGEITLSKNCANTRFLITFPIRHTLSEIA
ncbi:ATP-binding protein [Halobacteriovorax sp. HLS]|uniref:ATP-binding protein n=1 Tax=Halobacteriovorax sp. HLS TaxID=2234000 RepID=UPI000FDC7DDF|nr:ATP-binding protein [Halobacteriovorax sp. HLS]